MAACSSDDNRTPRAEQRWVADGPEVSCINRQSVRSTEVVDDRTINFVVNNRRMFVNRLPNACPGLAGRRTFKVNTRTTQFCSANSITVITGPGGQRGPTCGLGRFQPVVRQDGPPAPQSPNPAAN